MSDIIDTGEEEGAAGGGFFNHLPIILWQRKWLIIVPFAVFAIAGTALAFLLPKTYRSTATLLVESQELPSALVSSPLTTIIDQRIAKIREQVLSRGDLIELIEQNNLYEEQRRSKPLSTVVQKMQDATEIKAVTGDIGQAGGGQSGGTSTIAFTMAFEYADPVKAQAVMQSIVSRFLELDATSMASQASTTVDFFQDQARKLQTQIGDIESQITAIKARNGSALAAGGGVMVPNTGIYDAQLAQLRSENRQLLAQSRDADKNPMVVQAEAALVAARTVYSEDHPDVVRAKAQLAQAKEVAASQGPSQAGGLISGQVAANNQQISQLESLRAADSARASATMNAQSRAPVLSEQVMQLDARANGLRQQLNDVSNNLLRAQNSARMAQEQKGERLSIVDPPSAPDKPSWPNRLLLIGGGAGGGLALGLVMALLLEFVLRPVRGVEQLRALGLETLSVVPTLKPDDPNGRRPRRFRWPFRRRAPHAATA